MDSGQKLSLFEDRVRRAVTITVPEAPLSIVERQRYRLKIRINLGQNMFIDIFYNPKNDRTDFALIHNTQRIFGYDNLGGWHRHPAESPESHISCDEPPLEQVFQEMKEVFSTLSQNPASP